MTYLNIVKSCSQMVLVAAILTGLLSACANSSTIPLPVETGPAVTESSARRQASTPSSPTDEANPGTPTATPPVTSTQVLTPKFAATPLSEESVTQKSPQPLPQDRTTASLVQQARQDLAGRLAIQVDEIDFLAFESVVWPDGSLGCPQPGIAYIQVQREGYKILLGYAGREYAYHGGGSHPPFLCENK